MILKTCCKFCFASLFDTLLLCIDAPSPQKKSLSPIFYFLRFRGRLFKAIPFILLYKVIDRQSRLFGMFFFFFKKQSRPNIIIKRFFINNKFLKIFTPANLGGFLIFIKLLNNPTILPTLLYLTKLASKAQLDQISGGSFTTRICQQR